MSEQAREWERVLADRLKPDETSRLEQLEEVLVAADEFLEASRVPPGESCNCDKITEYLVPTYLVKRLWYAIEAAKEG